MERYKNLKISYQLKKNMLNLKENIKIIRDKGEKSKEENKGGKPGKDKR